MESKNMENNKGNEIREYRTDDLIVYWDAKACSHIGNCWNTLPQVFKPEERPWVIMEAATAEEIIKAIDKCPTDALKYALPEGSKVDPEKAKGPGWIDYKKDEVTSIKIKMARSGPYKVEGTAQVFDAEGNFLKQSNHIILCGCGKSGNRPFCDGSHARKE